MDLRFAIGCGLRLGSGLGGRLGGVEEFGGGEVFQGAAYAFEKGDFGWAGADLDFAGDDLMEIGEPVGAGDASSFGGDEEVTSFGFGAIESFDGNASALDGGVVEFTSVRLERAYGVDVSAGRSMCPSKSGVVEVVQVQSTSDSAAQVRA